MKYAQIRDMDISDGRGLRVSLYVQGCDFKCKGCFNSETWSFEKGELWTEELQKRFIDLGNKDYINGFTILGGEPMHPRNIETVSKIIHDIKSTYSNKTIWVYTGFTYEYLLEHFYYSLVNIDVLVDGQFIEEQKDCTLKFKGSRNQRLIDIQKSLKENRVVLYEVE